LIFPLIDIFLRHADVFLPLSPPAFAYAIFDAVTALRFFAAFRLLMMRGAMLYDSARMPLCVYAMPRLLYFCAHEARYH